VAGSYEPFRFIKGLVFLVCFSYHLVLSICLFPYLQKWFRLYNLAVCAGHWIATLIYHMFQKRTQCKHTIFVALLLYGCFQLQNRKQRESEHQELAIIERLLHIVPNTERSVNREGRLCLTGRSPSHNFIFQTTGLTLRYVVQCRRVLTAGWTTSVRFSTGATFSFRFCIILLYICVLHQVLFYALFLFLKNWRKSKKA
jgi:hypothetical protein